MYRCELCKSFRRRSASSGSFASFACRSTSSMLIAFPLTSKYVSLSGPIMRGLSILPPSCACTVLTLSTTYSSACRPLGIVREAKYAAAAASLACSNAIVTFRERICPLTNPSHSAHAAAVLTVAFVVAPKYWHRAAPRAPNAPIGITSKSLSPIVSTCARALDVSDESSRARRPPSRFLRPSSRRRLESASLAPSRRFAAHPPDVNSSFTATRTSCDVPNASSVNVTSGA